MEKELMSLMETRKRWPPDKSGRDTIAYVSEEMFDYLDNCQYLTYDGNRFMFIGLSVRPAVDGDLPLGHHWTIAAG